jgi:hypothetical protein
MFVMFCIVYKIRKARKVGKMLVKAHKLRRRI